MNNNLKDELMKASKYSADVIPRIAMVLNDNEIKYEKNNDTELIILDNDKTRDEIKELIYTNIDIPTTYLNMLLDIIDTDGSTYIRQLTQ